MRFASVALGAMLVVSCRGSAPGQTDERELAATVDTLRGLVETAVGLKFDHPPKFAVRSRDEVKVFLEGKLNTEFPPERVEGVEATYKLLELIPDTLSLKTLLLALYSEQVAGYYDPETKTLYAVRTDNKDQGRLILAHELVHALQDQRLPLDSLLHQAGTSDRQTAMQAVFEGHATIAMIGIMTPGLDVIKNGQFWQSYRDQVKSAQSSMKVFASAPLVLREGLIFPYLAGAEFMRWWALNKQTPLPAIADLPQSTEQVLHPDRYVRGDGPAGLTFVEPKDGVLYEDTFGELEIQIFGTVMRGGGEVLNDIAPGWGGDRFRVFRSSGGPALVWYSVWDDSTAARRFLTGPAARFSERVRPGYRTEVSAVRVGDRSGVRIVRAPNDWDRWARLPEVR